MKVSAKKNNVPTRTPGKAKRLLAGPLVVSQENLPTYQSTKLLITNLDHKVTDSDICELFSEFGSIREVAVHYNCWGYSLGTAHVVFLNSANAAEAARRYNGVPLDGRPMTITMEGTPHGTHGAQNPLPVKLRLSFGPNHKSNGRAPLSQVNSGGRSHKGVKRLENGPKSFRGLDKPRGRPAVLGHGNPVGRLPTAAELDLELDEYLSQKGKKIPSSAGKENDDDFGHVNDVLMATPYRSKKLTKTPKGTPKTPKRTPKGTTTPGKTPKATKTPGRTPKAAKSLATPGNTPKLSAKDQENTPKRTPGRPRKEGTPKVTPKHTPGKTPKGGKTPKSTPGKQAKGTPFKVKLVRKPKEKTEESVKVATETAVVAETEQSTESKEKVVEQPIESMETVVEPAETEAVSVELPGTDEEEKTASIGALKTPKKNATNTPARRRSVRGPSKTPSKATPAKKRKAVVGEPLEEGEIGDDEGAETLTELPDVAMSNKKSSKRRTSGRFASAGN